MDPKNNVVLVDENDHVLGYGEKLDVHKKGLLHRAFSVLVFNSCGELLLQQRAQEKYHCGGLWTNTVCSHPMPEESYEDAVHRRLQEEFGFDCEVEFRFDLVYRAVFDNGLTEYEFDKVFVGRYDGKVSPNLEEIMDYKWIGIDELKQNMQERPEMYTEWFKLIVWEKMGGINRDG